MFDVTKNTIFSEASGVSKGNKNTQGVLKQKLFLYEKVARREINRWWEVTSLNKYIEVGRVPRGLRIFIIPTFGNPNPKLLEEWAELMATTCKGMLGLLSKYAKIELDEICDHLKSLKEEIEKGTEIFKRQTGLCHWKNSHFWEKI